MTLIKLVTAVILNWMLCCWHETFRKLTCIGHPGLHKQWPRLHEHHNHRWRVLGVRVRPGTRHFPYNENPTRALNTKSLKCCLLSTDAIDAGKNSRMCMKVQRRLMQEPFIEIHQVFAKKKKRSDTIFRQHNILVLINTTAFLISGTKQFITALMKVE